MTPARMRGHNRALEAARVGPAMQMLRIGAVGALIVVAGFVLAYQFVEPAPPRHLTLATGGEQGNYYRIGQIYKRKLAEQGITVEVLPTQGSVDNLTRLQRGEADLGFIQSGIGSSAEQPGLLGLGSLYFEPLWVFTRAPLAPALLRDLKGKRLAVGSEGSGTWAIAALLLAENGIAAENTSLHRLSGEAAAWALAAGDIDAMFVVAAPDAPLIETLLADPQVRLMDFQRAEAYARRHRFLSVLLLPRGTIDPAADLPARDTRLLAPAATLVARAGLHPALQTLAVQVADEVHRPADMFSARGTFPSAQFVEFDMSPQAERFYNSGPSFLQRYLPFWAAVLVDRLWVMLIPLATLLIPLVRILPPVYQWRVRRRIYRMYRDLHLLEYAAETGQRPAAEIDAELERLDHEIRDLKVPLSYSQEVYALRLHLNLVRQRATAPA